MESSHPSRDAALQGDPVALTQALVRTPSVNPTLEKDGSGETAVATRIAGWLRAWGFETEMIEVDPGRFNVVARSESGRKGRTLLLNGHLDTVGVAGMTGDPFSGDVLKGVLRGRGACDMKAGIGALLAASHALRRDGHAGTLMVALTADEEHASVGMQSLIASGLKADGGIVCEPTSLSVMPANKGFVWVNLAFAGRAAHGSRPEEGQDAIMDAAAVLVGLGEIEVALAQATPHPLLGHGSLHAGTIDGGSAPSVYPDSCRVVVERRTLPHETPRDVEREFRTVLEKVGRSRPGLEGEIRLDLVRPGTEVDLDDALVTGIVDAIEVEGLQGRIRGMTAWVDAALLNEAGIPALCFGPGSIAQAHSADEWVAVEEIRVAARVLTRFGRTYLEREP